MYSTRGCSFLWLRMSVENAFWQNPGSVDLCMGCVMMSKIVSQKGCWKDIMTKEMVTVFSCGVTIGLFIRSGHSVKQPSFDYTNFSQGPFGNIDTLYKEPYCYAIVMLLLFWPSQHSLWRALLWFNLITPTLLPFDHIDTNSSDLMTPTLLRGFLALLTLFTKSRTLIKFDYSNSPAKD